MALSPGVSFQRTLAFDQPYAPGHGIGYSMDGVRTNRSVITMDGAPNTVAIHRWSAGALSTGSSPPADMVEEFKIQTVDYDASVGHTQGGVTSVTLKAGTNALHGAAGWSTQRPELNANLFFANKGGQPKSDFEYNRYNVNAGGPIVIPKLYNGKDKTFFMYGYEGIDHSYPRGTTMTVPTERQRQATSPNCWRLGPSIRSTIRRPASGCPAAATKFNRLPTTLSRHRGSTPSRRTSWVTGRRNATGTRDGINNLNLTNEPENLTYYNHIGRIDHNFGPRNRIFGRVNTYNRFSQHSDWFHSLVTGLTEDWLQHGAVLDHVFVVNPTTTLNLRYSFYRIRIDYTPKYAENRGFDLTKLGLPKSYADAIPPGVRAFPQVSIDG